MTAPIVSRPSTEAYRQGWERIWGSVPISTDSTRKPNTFERINGPTLTREDDARIRENIRRMGSNKP